MGDIEHIKKGDYESLVTQISETYSGGFQKTVAAIKKVFYLEFPISEKPSHQLSWSHYVELLKISTLSPK